MSKGIISPSEAARALGRLGGLATKGIITAKKKKSGRRNAEKARKALALKRASQKYA
jgi:hypothetical protein